MRAVTRNGASSSPDFSRLCKVVLPTRSWARTSCARRTGSTGGVVAVEREATGMYGAREDDRRTSPPDSTWLWQAAAFGGGEAVAIAGRPDSAVAETDDAGGVFREFICVLESGWHESMRNIQTQKGLPNLSHTRSRFASVWCAWKAHKQIQANPAHHCDGRSTAGP